MNTKRLKRVSGLVEQMDTMETSMNIKKETGVLTHSALSWWESLSPSDKPQTWANMKMLMRERFFLPMMSYLQINLSYIYYMIVLVILVIKRVL